MKVSSLVEMGATEVNYGYISYHLFENQGSWMKDQPFKK